MYATKSEERKIPHPLDPSTPTNILNIAQQIVSRQRDFLDHGRRISNR